MAENDPKIIKFTITRLLASREHSQHELLNKLLQRKFDRQLCIEWIEKFRQKNLQSDSRFAGLLVRIRTNKGIGESRIRNELKEHRISQDIIDAAIQEEDIDWFELALQVFEKKFANTAEVDWKGQQKQQRFMYYRGFSQEQIKYATESTKK